METVRFRSVLATEEQPVPGHGIVFKRGALSWPESVPLRLGFTDRIIGKVEKIERDGDDIRGDVVILAEMVPGIDIEVEPDGDGISGYSLAAEVLFDNDAPASAPKGKITTVAVVPQPAVRSE